MHIAAEGVGGGGRGEAAQPALTSMRAEQLVLNHGCKWQAVKQVCEHLPHPRAAILAQALLVEAVHLHARPGQAAVGEGAPGALEHPANRCSCVSARPPAPARQVKGVAWRGCCPPTCVICLLSWLPRMITTREG
jgi:hypothetical protein